jgi:hypothetical protein
MPQKMISAGQRCQEGLKMIKKVRFRPVVYDLPGAILGLFLAEYSRYGQQRCQAAHGRDGAHDGHDDDKLKRLKHV